MNKNPIIFSLFGHDELTQLIINACHFELGNMLIHQFPDQEIVVKIKSNVSQRVILFVANLVNPNANILTLLLAAKTAKFLGAKKIVLITPYLPYMRQDKIFEPGQGITSEYFAELISLYFDGLITIDPHLHRWPSLRSIYKIPTKVLHANNQIAHWIRQNVAKPILIGPDAESKQWVEQIAHMASAPYTILDKLRKSDTQVETSVQGLNHIINLTPVLIDDIISTGNTMLGIIRHLETLNPTAPICIGVHAIFSGIAYQNFLKSKIDKIITCNTIPHVSNIINISTEITDFLLMYPELEWDEPG